MNAMGSVRASMMVVLALALAGGVEAAGPAQEPAGTALTAVPAQPAVVPQTVLYTGNAPDRAGDTVEAAFHVYGAERGGDPLWSETQTVKVGANGRYSVLLGAATEGGLPQNVFADGQARWVGVSIERGEEQARSLLASVPYAMKAADAETLAGRNASEFVTQAQLAATAQSLATQAAVLALPLQAPTGDGSKNYLAVWTGSSSLADSFIVQTGTSSAPQIGIGISRPGEALDVNGGGAFRSALTLLPPNLATHSTALGSPLLELTANAFTSQLGESVRQTFAWQTVPGTNNVPSPTGSLNLLFGQGLAAPRPTGLSIAPNGQITFAGGQTFPGSVTAVTAISPLSASSTSPSSIAVGLDMPQLQSTLNKTYSQLGGANTFAGNQTVNGNLTVNSPIVALGGLKKPVGIGTTTPAYDLEVNSSNATRAEIAMVSQGTDAAISLNNRGSGGREYWIDSGSGGAGIGTGNFAVYDRTAGITRMVINRFGQVGIGVLYPNYAFEVSSPGASAAQMAMVSSGTDAAISLNNDALGGHEYWLDSGSPGAGVGAGNFGIYDKTWGITRMVVTSGGRVGIGTTTPQATLDVNGGVNASGSIAAQNLGSGTDLPVYTAYDANGSAVCLVTTSGNISCSGSIKATQRSRSRMTSGKWKPTRFSPPKTGSRTSAPRSCATARRP